MCEGMDVDHVPNTSLHTLPHATGRQEVPVKQLFSFSYRLQMSTVGCIKRTDMAYSLLLEDGSTHR